MIGMMGVGATEAEDNRTDEEIAAALKAKEGKLRRAQEHHVKADSFAQSIYLLMDEPDSSYLARLISVIIILMIAVSSFSFVIESLPVVKDDPSCRPVAQCGTMSVRGLPRASLEMQRTKSLCLAGGSGVALCAWTPNTCASNFGSCEGAAGVLNNKTTCEAEAAFPYCFFNASTSRCASRQDCSAPELQDDADACKAVSANDTTGAPVRVCMHSVSSCSTADQCRAGYPEYVAADAGDPVAWAAQIRADTDGLPFVQGPYSEPFSLALADVLPVLHGVTQRTPVRIEPRRMWVSGSGI